ncbi:invasion protein IalB [Roseovarius halotolerans]|uniref:Invasion associated locus B (IalB) protein n=1 Tax=Roseovarius halotolerans TaxID=505353 RepID=A0A1X6YNG0_9RHOB|nr:invasion associated locus B family protein [Roseovarius halotolerans]RKT34229.1 invasion protein IalB [Roseovarius halotolerans]SLN25740.1 Invasion associated locus B (IalB) protein [Roseovarius halotolerans]
MPKIYQTLPLIALLALGTSLSAQDTTADTAADTQAEAGATETESDQASDPAAEPATDATPQVQTGRAAQEDPTYIKEEYGDWQLKCFRSEAEEDPCQMYQLLTEEAGNPVAEFSLFRLPEGAQAAAGATIVVPLGTLLPEELKISVDGGRPKTYSYSFCTMVGCFARIGLTQADVDQLKAGAEGQLQIVPAQAPDQTVDIKVSLDGFTAAYSNVSVMKN